MVVLNVYNGDILGIQENAEYGLWFVIPLCLHVGADLRRCAWPVARRNHYLIWSLGAICNIYWYFFTPFEKNRSLRHRTEYYDTHAFLASIAFSEMTRTTCEAEEEEA